MSKQKHPHFKRSTFSWKSLQMLSMLLLVIGLVTAIVLYRQDRVYKISKASAPVLAHEQVVQGGSTQQASVVSEVIVARPDSLYLASISTKSYYKVKSVSGLGLNWTKVKSQCGARGTTGAELWMAVGSPASDGAVTATFDKVPKNSVIAVSRFSGVNLASPIGEVYGINTKGINGACSGGTDSDTYSFDISTGANTIAYGLVAERLRNHTPQSGFAEIIEFKQGKDNGDKAGIAVISKANVAGGTMRVEGTLNSDTDWATVVVSINGQDGTVPVSPTPLPSSTPVATVIASSSPYPTATPVATATPLPTVTSTPYPSVPPTSPSVGIWSSKEELASKDMSGPAWTEVLNAANKLAVNSNPDPDNQDDNTNVQVLAAAIVYARTNHEEYRTKVVNALRKVEVFQPTGRTLAWGREIGAYAMAADLVGYRTPAFEAQMRKFAEGYKCSQVKSATNGGYATLLEMYLQRPNNWGAMAFGSLAAIYRYLGDTQKLQLIRNHYVQTVVGPSPAISDYGSLTWQCKENDPLLINPVGCVKTCEGKLVNVEGIVPDDMRRGGSCRPDPLYTNYPWGQLEGLTMAARILERAGMPIWSAGDSAICRAASVLQDARFGVQWKAKGDDEWQLPILDRGCGKSWSKGTGTDGKPYGSGLWQHGKNTGWGYVL